MLAVVNLTKSYRTVTETVAVLRGVNLDVAAGESVALTGESGSGKSTLLHLIAGLDAADGGEIRLADSPYRLSDAGRAELRRDRLGLVFQQFNLIPSLSVDDNLDFQARIAGRHDAAWQDELVERLGLGNLLKRYPEQLSGGQQQRVAIGRALAPKPLLLLADEPTGNLDEDTADDVLALARDLVARSGCGFLMVTHSVRLAATLDRQVTAARGADHMKRALWILAVLLSHWRRHPMQLATLLIGLISATALWSGVQALNQQARNAYDRAAAMFGGARTAMLVGHNGATFPQKLFVDLRRAGWPVSPVLEGRIQIGGRSLPPARHRAGDAAGRGRQCADDRARPICKPSSRRPARCWSRRKRCPISGSPKARRRRPMTARRCRRCACSRNSCLTCWWSISASRSSS